MGLTISTRSCSRLQRAPCRNLDLPLCGKAWIDLSFNGYGGRCDLALIEGVMGLYDGIGSSSEGSSADVAIQLGLPVVLLVDAGGQARSLAALVAGFERSTRACSWQVSY